jgi:hypothetical protein
LEASIRRPEELATLVGQWLADANSFRALRQRYQQERLKAHPAQIVDRLLSQSVERCVEHPVEQSPAH